MDISFGELSVEIVRSTPDTEDLYGGRWGWFWHESQHPPRGPFSEPGEALADLTEWVSARYDALGARTRPSLDDMTTLASMFLRNADGFLHSAEGAGDEEPAVTLASACYALELILKAYLLSRGRSDDWNRDNLRHDLVAAYREATFLGLPSDDARIETFLKAAAAPYARNELTQLATQEHKLLRKRDYLPALRSLHREAERRIMP